MKVRFKLNDVEEDVSCVGRTGGRCGATPAGTCD